jgi:hypothetical protein
MNVLALVALTLFLGYIADIEAAQVGDSQADEDTALSNGSEQSTCCCRSVESEVAEAEDCGSQKTTYLAVEGADPGDPGQPQRLGGRRTRAYWVYRWCCKPLPHCQRDSRINLGIGDFFREELAVWTDTKLKNSNKYQTPLDRIRLFQMQADWKRYDVRIWDPATCNRIDPTVYDDGEVVGMFKSDWKFVQRRKYNARDFQIGVGRRDATNTWLQDDAPLRRENEIPPEGDAQQPSVSYVSASEERKIMEMLGLQEGYNARDLRKAYLRKAMKHHPDRLGVDATQAEQDMAKAQFQKYNEANEVLSAKLEREASVA